MCLQCGKCEHEPTGRTIDDSIDDWESIGID